jgi:hypothetical protein
MTATLTSVPTFTSTAVQSISDIYEDNLVDIVFTSSDTVYTYQVADVEAWMNDLIDTIEEDESVGSFVNRAISSKVISLV